MASTKMTTSTTSSEEEEENCDPNLGCQRDASILILIFLAILLLSVLVVYCIIRIDLHYIPESVAVIVFGVIVGIIAKYTHDRFVDHVSTFSPELFFLFILPAIIFETGFSLNKTEFFGNIYPILALSIIGTLIAFFGVSFGLYLFGKAGISLPLPIFDSLIFGSIACATDPVATLAIFKALGVDQKLYMIVLGESILNDAVSLIIFKAVNTYTVSQVWIPILLFIGISIGSVIMGLLVAMILSLILKWLNLFKYPAIETLFVILFAYISYLLANTAYLSGILSTFFCGLTFQKYGYKSLSVIHSSFGALALAVFPLIALLNKVKLSNINGRIQFVVFLSGLRGAISFSLSLSGEYHSEYQDYIKTQMILLVYFTIFVFGLCTYPSLKGLKIKSADSDQTMEFIGQPLQVEPLPRRRKIRTLFSKVDEKYLTRFLTRRHTPGPKVDEQSINVELETQDAMESTTNDQDDNTYYNDDQVEDDNVPASIVVEARPGQEDEDINGKRGGVGGKLKTHPSKEELVDQDESPTNSNKDIQMDDDGDEDCGSSSTSSHK
ncbi:hypothetical protein SAMD00019534_087240 [Acytostelium subglobosum LB1]|uniref:hypothetical protein n=1 Tax=Acytostelium subglobosum LB1 TaxID=1410327 RepID=UPI000644BCEE|nr:hypothetical protein SAMD00019534_087240 [Acytostelium subglobosum LB1]GAM25549.1 hypothetical protein SAMD00019534_087240 [Acytostelium subglobosum LB1]|eukprot:XP_012751535.1 hypothetical protein SAMD00019534_087240 [Acytostelium subglobosum LB1]